MTSEEMLKKLGLMAGKDGKNSGKLKEQTLQYLKEGKDKLALLEKKVMASKIGKKLQSGLNLSKKKLSSAKQAFDKFEKGAERYIEKNPKKAVALAAAAGVLAGSLWLALKPRPLAKKKK